MNPLLQQAIAREQRGDLAGAMAGYRELLARAPDNIDALYLLGRAHCQRGEFGPGLETLRKVVARAPRHPGAHNLIGMVLSRTGQPAEALAAFERAVAADARFAPAVANLADALGALGRHADAVTQYDRALALDDRNLVAWSNRGLALEALGRDAEAAESFQRALKLKPDLAEAHYNLGNTLFRLRRLDDAIRHYEQAVKLRPDLYANLGASLFAAEQWEEAAKAFAQAVKLQPNSPDLHYQLGRALWQAERYEDSIASFDKVLALNPKHVRALASKGRVLYVLGRIDDGRALLEQAIALDPRDANSYLSLSDMKRFTPDDPHLAAMTALLDNIDTLPSEQQIDLHFALGKAYRDIGEPARAFRHLAKSNELKRRQADYDEQTVLAHFARIAEIFTPELMRSKAGAGDPSDKPIFIIGMPRSGTTLIEQILASHPRVHGAGERTDFRNALFAVARSSDFPDMVAAMTPAQFGEVGAAYVAHMLTSAPSTDRFTDKMPANYVHAGLIHLALPHARIIHVRRDPIDTCVSCFSTSFETSQKFAYDLGELGRFYRAYERLMAHWRQVLPANAMLEVHYEDMVEDIEGQTRRLLAHCGLEWNDACLAFHKTERPVRTASATQVRQPIYGSAVGRWRHYRDQLQPLFEALGVTPD